MIVDQSNKCYQKNYLSEQTAGHFDGLVKDYNISIVNALEILQSCTNPSIHNPCKTQDNIASKIRRLALTETILTARWDHISAQIK